MVPFPVYPWLHVQVKLPGVLVHIALESQLVVPSSHSLMSEVSIKIVLMQEGLLFKLVVVWRCIGHTMACMTTEVSRGSHA